MSMSLGGVTSSNIADNAVQTAVSLGIVTTVAAGNSDAPACDQSPARSASGRGGPIESHTARQLQHCWGGGGAQRGSNTGALYPRGVPPPPFTPHPPTRSCGHPCPLLAAAPFPAITVSSSDASDMVQVPSCYGSCVDVFSPGRYPAHNLGPSTGCVCSVRRLERACRAYGGGEGAHL
jgi:hypothetical protein